MKIKIISCFSPTFWYSHSIGAIYEVEEALDKKWYKVTEIPYKEILKTDCDTVYDKDCIHEFISLPITDNYYQEKCSKCGLLTTSNVDLSEITKFKPLKFKYFYDPTKGMADEKQVNEWLENKNIEITAITSNSGFVFIFYKEL